MCMGSQPAAKQAPPPPAPPPPPEKPPEALESAVDSNAEALKKKKSGATSNLSREASGLQAGSGSNATSGLKIG